MIDLAEDVDEVIASTYPVVDVHKQIKRSKQTSALLASSTHSLPMYMSFTGVTVNYFLTKLYAKCINIFECI